MLTARTTYDLSERMDIGLLAGAIHTLDSGETRSVLGVETGYLLHANLWLSAGYNANGFHADDLVGENYTDRGCYLRLRFKFDESLFRGDPYLESSRTETK
jgi:hypothetical protein